MGFIRPIRYRLQLGEKVMEGAMKERVPALALEGIGKQFGSFAALRGVSLSVMPGEIHALCGENGAGKSTLIKVVGGTYPAGSYEGVMRVSGEECRFAGPSDAAARGVAVIHQELALVEEFTVMENLFLGVELGRPLLRHDEMEVEARRLLEGLGFDLPLHDRAGELGGGQRQLLEIARALSRRAQVLILDEPTAALAAVEAERLREILVGLRERGVAMVYISHRLEEVFALADRISVLRDGELIGTGSRVDWDEARLIRAMVGRDVNEVYPASGEPVGEDLLRVEDVAISDGAGRTVVSGVSFVVRSGEVFGIGGLMGSGRTELLSHLAGAWGERVSGEVWLGDGRYRPESVGAAMELGVGFVTEDRRRLGLILEEGIGFNLTLSSLSLVSCLGVIDAEREAVGVDAALRRYTVRAGDDSVAVGRLSGGNQQKVVLGRVMGFAPRVLLLDEPTRGIDVGAKREVYDQIRRFTVAGGAVVMVSSDLPELMGMSDRVAMMRGGVMQRIHRRGVVAEELMRDAVGSGRA
jgi:D-xylose transport system ATP-binding protein